MQYLAHMISNHLSTYHRVDIADIGSLELVHHPAKLDVSGDSIAAPSKSIDFYAKKPYTKAYSLFASQVLQTASDDKREELIRIINDLGPSIVEATEGEGRYEIPQIGSFYREQGVIQFAQDESSPLIAAGRQLANIKFVPIKRLEVVKRETPIAPPKPSPGKNIKQLAVTLVFVLIFVNVGLLGWALLKKFQTNSFDRIPVNLPEGRVNVKPSDEAPLPNALPMPVDSTLMNPDSMLSPELQEDSSGLFQSFTPESAEETEVDPPELKESEAPMPDVKAAPKSPTSIPPKDNRVNNSSTLLQLNAKGADCALVLGAFSNAANIARMKSQLESEGYRVYEERGGSLTRVGILVPCEDSNTGLREARDKYNPDAWVFKIK